MTRFFLFTSILGVSVVLSLLLVAYPVSTHLHGPDHIVAHDSGVPATISKAMELFDVVVRTQGGFLQGITPPVLFTTGLWYGILIRFGLSPAVVYAVGMTLTFVLVLFLTIAGFYCLFGSFGREAGRGRLIDACLIGVLYSVAPFTLNYMSFGVFWAINVAVAIGIMPFMFYFFFRCFFAERTRILLPDLAGLTLCLIVIASSILFIFPAVIILSAILLCRGEINRHDLAKLGGIGLLLFIGALPALYGMYLIAVDPGWRAFYDVVMPNAAYGNIKGGVLTGFLQHSSWIMYTAWTPRLVLGFASHFTAALYTCLTMGWVVLVALGVVMVRKGRNQVLFRSVLIALLISLFFVKGGGAPFGGVFESILMYLPGGGLIRSPDTKFGIFVILSLSCAAAVILSEMDEYSLRLRIMLRFVLAALVVYHARPLIDGRAILAVNSELASEENGMGYVVALTPAESRIIAMLNSESEYGVLSLPPGFGLSYARQGGVFAYRNVVAHFALNPFYYSDLENRPDEVNQRIQMSLSEGQDEQLGELGIGFVLVDRNALSDTADKYKLYDAIRQNKHNLWRRIFDGGGYELYRLVDNKRKPLVAVASKYKPSDVRMVARANWFILFDIMPPHADNFFVTLRTTYNKHWCLMPWPKNLTWAQPFSLLRALLSRPREEYMIRKDAYCPGHVNVWNVVRSSPGDTGKNVVFPSGGRRLLLLFVPQVMMFALIAVSVVVTLFCAGFMVKRNF